MYIALAAKAFFHEAKKKKSFNGKKERERKAKKEDGIKEVKTAAKILSSSS